MAEPTINPCPCGATPKELCLEGEGRHGTATCQECGVWQVAFSLDYDTTDSMKTIVAAIQAWNDAPREGLKITTDSFVLRLR